MLKRSKRKTPEGQLKFEACQYLATCHRDIEFWLNASVGIRGRKNNSRYQRNGTADLLGILPGGRLLAVEFKATSGKLTDEQRAFLDMVNRMGGIAGCVHSISELQSLIELAELNEQDERGEDN